MRDFVKFLIALIALTSGQSIALAASQLAEAERNALAARSKLFIETFARGDFASQLDFLPPKVLARAIKNSGVSPSKFRAVYSQLVKQKLDGIKLQSAKMDIDQAEMLLTPDGNRTYVRVPTIVEMELQAGQRVEALSYTVAIKDSGEWYLARVQGAQALAMLREEYPEFGSVEFPEETFRRIQ